MQSIMVIPSVLDILSRLQCMFAVVFRHRSPQESVEAVVLFLTIDEEMARAGPGPCGSAWSVLVLCE